MKTSTSEGDRNVQRKTKRKDEREKKNGQLE